MQGFRKCSVEYGVYVKCSEDKHMLIICLYVDDLLVTGSSSTEIEDFKSQMKMEFEMTDLGKLTYFLGMELLETSGGVVLHQAKYANEILRKFEMMVCNSSVTHQLPQERCISVSGFPNVKSMIEIRTLQLKKSNI
jgi:hypothetical protein